jgi:hypothetical protein
VLVALALFGAVVSFRVWRQRVPGSQTATPGAGEPQQFLAIIGTGVGVLFALIIAVQGTASFFLTGCEP